MLSAIHTVANSALVKILPPQQSVLLVPSTGCLSGGLSSVSFWWQMKGVLLGADAVVPFRKQMKGVRPVEYAVGPPGGYAGYPFWGRCRVSVRGQMQDILPEADTIELHEIHLARQSSLQVPVGHIPVPGGIKLCSPGTFGVANYLIINDGSCQVNFTKHAVGWSSCRKIYQQGSQQDKVIGLPVYWKAELG